MPRTVAALYDSRDDAELVRARLVSSLKIKSPRIIGKDTAGAIDGMNFSRKDADTYRDEVRSGAHLLVAQVAEGVSAKQLVELLDVPDADEPEAVTAGSGSASAGHGVEVTIPGGAPAPATAKVSTEGSVQRADEQVQIKPAEVPAQPPERKPGTAPEARVTPSSAARAEETEGRDGNQEIRVGKSGIARGGARVRSFTREAPAEEEVKLQDELIEVGSRPSDRQLSDSEIEAGGLFTERVFEIAEMREEPVVTKVAYLREEIIVKKTMRERTETVRDTVRHTDVEVEDISPSANRDS